MDGLVYVDANNVVIGPASVDPVFIDADGVIWRLDLETARPAVPVVDDNFINLFETDTCSNGAKLGYPLAPMVAFKGALDPSGTHRWRAPRGQVEKKVTRSKLTSDGRCVPSPFGATPIPIVPMPGLSDGSEPSGLPFYGPIHLRKR